MKLSKILLMVLFCAPAFAVDYIQPKPLREVVKTPVATVKPGQQQLPIISWGADMATIYANGNSQKTTNKSLFAAAGLDFSLVREDVFATQLSNYLSGQTPYLRGTMGMLNMAADVLNKDSRTKPVIIFKLSDSSGGDALVVKDSIRTVADLKGKTIVLQAYGPHVDYLTRILQDAGMSLQDVKLRWVADLTGSNNSPAAALRTNEVDAAFVITPDALALTSNGAVGTGSEDSVKGARILLSTKTASKVIVDVYAVRSDYLQQQPEKVQAFVSTLLKAQEEVATLVTQRNQQQQEYSSFLRESARLLLDAETATADAEGLYQDAALAMFNGNKTFFSSSSDLRRFEVIAEESLAGVKALQMASGSAPLTAKSWNYELLRSGIGAVKAVESVRFDENAAAAIVSRKQQQGSLADGELYSFEVYFAANQNAFSADLYKDAFDKVINLASTYGGALITVEGHTDPMGYLRQKKADENALVLGRVKQSAKNLSFSRAQSVRSEIIAYANTKGLALDPSQFVTVGHGIALPKTGICGDEPCAPKTEQEWRSNMRVVFRIIQVEAEADVFKPL